MLKSETSSHRIATRPARAAAGDQDVSVDPSVLASVAEDAAHFPGGRANGVARPATEGDVAALVRRHERLLAIGAQSSLTGGATPQGEIVVDMQRFDRIITIGRDEAVVQPGVPVGVLQAALGREGKYFPPVPTFDGAFVGGVVATNAAGAATFKYGPTRPWIRRLDVVLANGEVLEVVRGETTAHPDGYFEIVTGEDVVRVPIPRYTMPDVAKCAAGYFARPGMDLIDLFIGSEGTLGIITEVTLAVVAPAPHVALLWIPLPDETRALALATTLRAAAREAWRSDGAGVDVAAIEHVDARSLALLREDGATARHDVPIPDATSVALLAHVELSGSVATDPGRAYAEIGRALEPTGPETPLVRLCRILENAGVLATTEIALPGDRRRQAQLTAVREAVPEAVNRRVGAARRRHGAAIKKTAADMIVPYDRFADSLAVFRDAFAARGLDYAIWGHISDGNVHPNVIPRTAADVTAGHDAILACGRAIIDLGGSPLAEHGVGRHPAKQALLRLLYGEEGLDEMRAVKRALDPHGKLAPGVVFTAASY